MIRPILNLAAFGMFFLVSCSHSSGPPQNQLASSELPAIVSAFKTKIADMNAGEVRAAAIAQFGEPTRDVGSGRHIYEWDVAGGVLTVNPPAFRFADGKSVWLIDTENEAQESLCQEFEMTTLPDPSNHGSRFWIGDIDLKADGSYLFVDSDSNLKERGNQSGNFFIKHPSGRVQIIWAPGVGGTSRLETLGDRQIAVLRCFAEDDRSMLRCNVMSSAKSRRLSISGPAFTMETGWPRAWSIRSVQVSETR